MSDLEQICMQKVCEGLLHKTQLGDLHQIVKKQEQIIENLRKDVQQLSKQARDLDIVNKKLINELKGQNGKQKPLVPLKITRSVGLQVKLTVSTDQNRKRPPNTPNRPNTNSTPSTTPINNRPRSTPTANSTVVRQVNNKKKDFRRFLSDIYFFSIGRTKRPISSQTPAVSFNSYNNAHFIAGITNYSY